MDKEIIIWAEVLTILFKKNKLQLIDKVFGRLKEKKIFKYNFEYILEPNPKKL